MGGRRRKAIVAAFEANPGLHSRVRKVTTDFVTYVLWTDRWYESPDGEEARAVAETRWPRDDDDYRGEDGEDEAEAFLVASLYVTGEAGWLDDDGPRSCERSVADSFWVWVGQHSVSESDITCVF